ncbi:28S ribosomal protein S2, mitochondrial [Ischnura elegans]|uniref:28S ribosomal protein S2, mitochondrial n=1 Tax=Ischnura elegans TaxID=197161 RepID=UPI001ED8BB15|nr:28S ribosomal protein S2, mitochondrial [Ischnura elegans]
MVRRGCQILRTLGLLSRNYGPQKTQVLFTSTQSSLQLGREEEAPVQKGDILPDPGFKVRDLFEAGVQWGHKIGSLDPRMAQYLFGERLGHCIFDLDITAKHLHRALQFTCGIAALNGIILFASGRDPRNAHAVEKAALEAGEYAHVRAWKGGVFTNSTFQFGCTVRLPDLVIMTNVKPSSPLASRLDQHYLVRDSAKMGIPTIGIVDSDCNPNLITYPVPGDDDSPRAISLYLKLFVRAILVGKDLSKRKIQI